MLTPRPNEDGPTADGDERYPHGTRARYGIGKCRCDLCRAANAAYTRERAALNQGDWYVERIGAPIVDEIRDEPGFKMCSFCERSRPLKGFRQHEAFCARQNPRTDLSFVVINRATGERSERIHRLLTEANEECETRNASNAKSRDSELIDSTRARDKIQKLMAEGITMHAIAEATNIPIPTLRGIAIGRYKSTNRRYLEALLRPFENNAAAITRVREAIAMERAIANHPKAQGLRPVTLPLSRLRLTQRAADAALLFYRFNGTEMGARPISIPDAAVAELVEAGHLTKIGVGRASKYEIRLKPDDLEAYAASRDLAAPVPATLSIQNADEIAKGRASLASRGESGATPLEHVILSPDELRYVRAHARDYLAFATANAERAHDARRQAQVTLDALHARASEILARTQPNTLTVADATQRAIAELQGPTFADILQERWKPVMFALFGIVDDDAQLR